MSINDLVGMLMEVPPKLAAFWGVWFAAGLLLSIWGRREKMYVSSVPVPEPQPRKKSGVRPPSGSHAAAAPKKPVSSVPLTSGDAFGELEQLLDSPVTAHRTPGEQLPAPQALP